MLGVKARKEKNKKRAKTLCELERENYELKHAQDKHDDELAELDMELKEAKLELGKALAKVDKLEKEREADCVEHDDWICLGEQSINDLDAQK